LNLRNSRFWVFIIIFLLLISLGSTQAYDWKKNWHKPALEFFGATVGDAVTGITGMAITVLITPHTNYMDDWPASMSLLLIGYSAGELLGAPLGTVLTGKILHHEGSVKGAYVGSLIGTVLGGLSAIYFADKNTSGEIVLPTILLPSPLCSVIGYNLFPHKSASQSFLFLKNFPELALTVLPEKNGNKISSKIGARVTVRF
jgi:hypothetical protein